MQNVDNPDIHEADDGDIALEFNMQSRKLLSHRECEDDQMPPLMTAVIIILMMRIIIVITVRCNGYNIFFCILNGSLLSTQLSCLLFFLGNMKRCLKSPPSNS